MVGLYQSDKVAVENVKLIQQKNVIEKFENITKFVIKY